MGLKARIGTALAPAARGYVRHVPGRVGKAAVARRVLEPALRGAPRRFEAATVDGLVLGGSTQDMIQRYVYVFGVWEPNLTAWLRTRPLLGRTFVDVGANVGYFTMLGSRLVGGHGRVVAVEPLPTTFAQLQENLRRNGLGNVRAVEVAATAERRTVDLFGGEAHNSGTTSTLAGEGLRSLGSVPGVPLSELLADDEVETARVVKIDVEGGEPDALRGLLAALDRMPDDIELVIELTPDLPDGGTDAVLSLLAERGFLAYELRNDYSLRAYAERAPYEPPRRLRSALPERTDVVFSRVDAEVLP